MKQKYNIFIYFFLFIIFIACIFLFLKNIRVEDEEDKKRNDKKLDVYIQKRLY